MTQTETRENDERLVTVRSSTNSGVKVYHTKECRKYPQRRHKITLEQAETMELEECTYCSGDFSQSKNMGGLPEFVLDAIEAHSDGDNHV